jgi:hypothetical protein
MVKNLASFALVTTVFSLGGFAILAGPRIVPNHEGLAQCQKLHPMKYCKIVNGFTP